MTKSTICTFVQWKIEWDSTKSEEENKNHSNQSFSKAIEADNGFILFFFSSIATIDKINEFFT